MGKRTRTSEGWRVEDRSSTSANSNEGLTSATVRDGKRGGAKLRYKTAGLARIPVFLELFKRDPSKVEGRGGAGSKASKGKNEAVRSRVTLY